MTEQVRHVFSTVKIVPNPATGEFASLAAIAGSDVTGEWTIRGLQNERRARQFCGHDAIVAGHDFVSRIGMLIDLEAWTDDEYEEDSTDVPGFDLPVSEAWLADMAARNRHVVQLSPPHPIIAASADEALDMVFANMLPEPERRRRSLTKWALVGSMGQNYHKVGLESHREFERKVSLVASGPKRFRHTIDFVVADSQARQLVQTWSFQIADQADLARDVKAWGWTIRELRRHGARARVFGKDVSVSSDVDLEVVVASPTDPKAQDRYAEALSVFEELDATVNEHGAEEAVANRAADLLGRL